VSYSLNVRLKFNILIGSTSGNCWRALPLEEKRVWEIKAKHAKAEHKQRYPGYRFRPVHNKQKRAERAAAALSRTAQISPQEERRCEEVAQLLLEGKKGIELADAVRALDARATSASPTSATHPAPLQFEWPPVVAPQPQSWAQMRRPSSVPPLPTHSIALPNVPFLAAFSRPESPVGHVSRAFIGTRRTSSVPPVPPRSWLAPPEHSHFAPFPPATASSLPEADTSLFEPSFFDATPFGTAPMPLAPEFDFAQFAPMQHQPSPLDTLGPHEHHAAAYVLFNSSGAFAPHSVPASAYSGSPAPSDGSISAAPSTAQFADMVSQQQQQHLAAPQPQRAPSFSGFDLDQILGGAQQQQQQSAALYAPEAYIQPEFVMPGYDVSMPAGVFETMPAAKLSPGDSAYGFDATTFDVRDFMHTEY
jgi:hypothetical protein